MPDECKSSTSIEMFVSYAHNDEALKIKLKKHLAILKKQYNISIWTDREIGAGSEWKGKIDDHLNSAHIILLLISSDFLDSGYCYDIEMKQAMRRHEAGDAVVIPIILRPVDWRNAPFAKLQALPKDARPVVKWKIHDSAFKDIAEGIRLKIENSEFSSGKKQGHISSKTNRINLDKEVQHIGKDLLPIIDAKGRKDHINGSKVAIVNWIRNLYKHKDNWLSHRLEAKPAHSFLHDEACHLFQSCRYEEALKTYEKIIRIDPKFTSAWTNEGMVLETLGRYNEALEAYESSIKLDPNHALARTNKGIILRKMGKYEDALKSFDKSIELDPNDALAWIHKGMVLENLGRYKQALEIYKNATELEPDYSPTWTYKIAYLEKIYGHKVAMESKERDAYLETEKEIFEEMETKALQKEEANLLTLLDQEANKEAEVEFEELQDTALPLVEERVVSLNKAKRDEWLAFLKNMEAVDKEEKRIEAAEAREAVASYLETEKEILVEIETKAIEEEEVDLLNLLDQEAEEEAKIEIAKWCYLDINLVDVEKITAHLNKAKEEEKADFLKKMDEAARDERAIEVAEEQESVSYLEIEKEFLEEIETRSIQKEEAILLSQMDQEAAEEAEMESGHDSDIYLAEVEKIPVLLNKAKEKEKTDFLKIMDRMAKDEAWMIEDAERQETISYLEKEKEFFMEIETRALQKEEATLLSLLSQEAAEEAEIEIDRWLGPDIHIVEFEERIALLNKVKEKDKTDFLKKMEEMAKDEWAIEVAEAQESASYSENVKEILEEIETKALQKEEAALLDLMDQGATEEVEIELESREWQDIESYLAEERAAFLKKMDEESGNEKDIEEYLEKKRKLCG